MMLCASRSVFLGCLGLLMAIAAKAIGAGFVWQDPEGDHVDLLYDDRPAFQYKMPMLDESSDQRRNDTFKPYHHVYSPDGKTLLTKGPGGLFPHHRGLFYGFNKITYGNGKTCDTWHCTGKSYQSHKKFLSQSADEQRAGHCVVVDWHGQDGEVFAHEERRLDFSRPTHHGVEGWRIDFSSRLSTADGQPIHLDGDPQHAGFQFRASQRVPDETASQTYYLRTDGKGKPGDYRNWDQNNPAAPGNAECENRPWNALSVILDGQRYTVLYLDHPANPKPSRYSERDYGRFGSYFAADVTEDEPLEVKYRLWVQPGEMSVEQCEALSKEFVTQ